MLRCSAARADLDIALPPTCCGFQDGEDLTWKTKMNLDSAEYPTLTNAPGKLLELARGADNDIDMLENSYAANSTSTPFLAPNYGSACLQYLCPF